MRLPASKYRGVVPQQSGKWGAQIYNQNERIWLGTFRTEVEAAQTYDIAARCIHEIHAVTNFDSFSSQHSQNDHGDDLMIIKFLKSRTTAEIIDMLRTHTYREEFERSLCKGRVTNSGNAMRTNGASNNISQQLLFYKIVSAADVGPQNRLLIPKQHAQSHFPCLERGAMISFEDEMGKVWRFRYSFWGSNGHHVLNGGWAQFAREKRLRPGDVVKFWRATDELGDVHFFIESDGQRTTRTSQQSTEIIRLFGVDVVVNVNSSN